jgi:hypothetical protein
MRGRRGHDGGGSRRQVLRTRERPFVDEDEGCYGLERDPGGRARGRGRTSPWSGEDEPVVEGGRGSDPCKRQRGWVPTRPCSDAREGAFRRERARAPVQSRCSHRSRGGVSTAVEQAIGGGRARGAGEALS